MPLTFFEYFSTFYLSVCILIANNARVLFGCAVMKSMNSRQDYWQGDRTGAELKIRTLQDELERITLEKSRVLERSVVSESWKEELRGQER